MRNPHLTLLIRLASSLFGLYLAFPNHAQASSTPHNQSDSIRFAIIRFQPELPKHAPAQCLLNHPLHPKALPNALRICHKALIDSGYAEASIDSTKLVPASRPNQYDTLLVFLHAGKRYTFSNKLIPFTEKHLRGYLAQDSIPDTNAPSITPFSSIRLNAIPSSDSTFIIRKETAAPHPIPIQNIEFVTQQNAPLRIRKPLLVRLAGLDKGDSLTPLMLKRITPLPPRHPNLNWFHPTTIRYTPQGAAIALYPSFKKNSAVAGQIALAPGSGKKKTVLTGYLDLRLSNLLKNTETLTLNWKGTGPNNHRFALAIDYPYIRASPWGIALSANLRVDSARQQLANAEANLLYAPTPSTHYRIGIALQKTKNRPQKTYQADAAHANALTSYLIRFQARYQRTQHDFPYPNGLTATLTLAAGTARSSTKSTPPNPNEAPTPKALPRAEGTLAIDYAHAFAPTPFGIRTLLYAAARGFLKKNSFHRIPAIERIEPVLGYALHGFQENQIRTTAISTLILQPYASVAHRTFAILPTIQYGLYAQPKEPNPTDPPDPAHLIGYAIAFAISAPPASLAIAIAQGHIFTSTTRTTNPWLVHLNIALQF